ncbi:MAG TPA: hypothetical protein VFH56_13440 [Acidimicrobiales bacterium]|nr:hypothetical protein [Acidimicrobiales bacterium]
MASSAPRRADQVEPDLGELAARAAEDPSARAFADEVKKAVADGTIRDQLANQEELRTIIEEHRS